MSEYDYDVAPRRRRSHRTRERGPEYVEETTYIQRGPGRASTDLVFRGREDSVEDIPRDFPPTAEYRRTKYRDEYPPRRTRSVGRRGNDYDDDYYSDYGPAGAGAAAGYAAARSGRNGDRRYRGDDYHSDYDDRYDRPRRDRRKSKVEELAEGAGLGGIVAAITGKDRSRSRSRGGRNRSRRRSDDDRSLSDESRGGDNRRKWQQAAKAAVITGVVEAVRSRNEPGGWAGPKGQRVATAALGAAGIDGFLDKDPDRKSKRHIVESVIGGLAATRLANGPHDQSGSRGRSLSRSRSRSQSRTGYNLRSRSRSLFGRGRSQSRPGSDMDDRGGDGKGNLKNIAALGGIAAAGKAIYDRVRSKSRGRNNRSRSRSSSRDSFVPTRRQRYGRDRDSGPPDPYGSDDDRVTRPRGRDGGGETNRKKRDSSNSSVSTTDLENQRKRTRGKELLTAGLATVATIHAAHGVYSSMVASEKRHKMVLEGEMSSEEARKRKSKNMLQDAAAVGIAALGIKSAFTEWKEMNEMRHSLHELEERRRKRGKARERRQKEMGQAGAGNQSAYLYPVTYPQPMAYADGNPYAAAGGNLPPPPMGVVQPPLPRY